MTTQPLDPRPETLSVGELPEAGPLEYTREEILTGHDFEEPLIAGDVRCHGGFIDGKYTSPRTRIRVPAIAAWQRRLLDDGDGLLDFPVEYVRPHYPNFDQAKLLLQEGVVDPISRSLTIISIVEGFGARIRDVPLPDLHEVVKEDIGGTALQHLGSGLFEAHARDEAGHRHEGGHKQMWEAARDLGLSKPEIPSDVLMQLMSGGGRRQPGRAFPELEEKLERAITMLANVMVVEVFAEDVFEWAKALLGDPEVSADPVAAGTMVGHIQADEKPHVDYLRTVLSELRARTLISEDGKKEFRGAEVIDTIFARQLRGMATQGPRQEREAIQEQIHAAIDDHARAGQIARQFESLDSGWTFPKGENESLDLLMRTA